MGDDGQMILLSALVACLCLFGVVACIAAAGGAYGEGGHFPDGMENVRWAQDCALGKAAYYNSAYPWDGRGEAASRFKSDAGSSLDSLAGELLKRGEAYVFSFNSSLAGDYLASHPGNGTVNIDGVLVEPSGGSARICGCALDVSVYYGGCVYRESRVLAFK